MPSPSEIVLSCVQAFTQLSLQEIESNATNSKMGEHRQFWSDSDDADVENNLIDYVETDLPLNGTRETPDCCSPSDSAAGNGGQLAINLVAQQNGSTNDISDHIFVNGNDAGASFCSPSALSEEDKKQRRAIRFGSANGERSYPTNAHTDTQRQGLDSTKPFSNLGKRFANGNPSSSVRKLSDEEKKQQRALRFGTSNFSEKVTQSRRTSKTVEAELGNPGVISRADIRERAASPEAETSLVEPVLSAFEAFYENHREEVVASNGLVSTPLHALKECVTYYKETIHQEFTCLLIAGAHKPLIRTEIILGRFKGTGEAYDKRASTQMAALDILLKMEESGLRVVPCGLLPGWRISPRVCDDLYKFCHLNGLQAPRFITSSNVEKKHKPAFRIECFLGSTLMSRVDTDVIHYGRKQTAAQTLEQLTEENYPREYLAFGVSCMGYKELVENGFKPVMSDRKRTWILEQFKQNGEAAFRYGVDRDELHALQLDLTNSRIQENGRSVLKRRLVVTVSANGANQMPKRKVMWMTNQ